MDESTKQAIKQMKETIYGWLKNPEKGQQIAVDLLKRLDDLQDSLLSDPGNDLRKPTVEAGQRGQRIERYTVEVGPKNANYLCEYRSGVQQPFRVPEEVYNATATAVAQLKGLADFGRISEEVTKILNETPAEYLLRVCIRFWQHGDQPLIEKTGPRYQAKNPKTFQREAKEAWAKLKIVNS